MEKELLKRNYENACNAYLLDFCERFDLMLDGRPWLSDEAGTLACIGDHYYDFDGVIRYVVDNDLKDYDEILEWEDYTSNAALNGFDVPDLKAWHNGCPRVSDDIFRKLEKMRKDIEDLCEQEKERLKNEKRNPSF